jgi:hypothetical protein
MLKCPVCSTEYIEQGITHCLTCRWDLTPYPLGIKIPEEVVEKEKSILSWSQEIIYEEEKQKSYLVIETTTIQPQEPQQFQTSQTLEQNSIQIYEFSREFINISQKDGKWVSGGFGSEIGLSNRPVPEKIQDIVKRGDFQINDNYPPKENEYALIAWEVDEYSVLTVATRLEDDKTRFFNAYRYFWLEKNASQDIDGIGTLLIWWRNAGEPKFDFQWNPSNSTLEYTATSYSQRESYEYFERYSRYVENILPIKYYPYAFVPPINNADALLSLHYLALDLNRKHKISISWAANVNRLEHPEKLSLICYADEHGYQINNKILKQYQKLLSTVQSAPQSKRNPITDSRTINYNQSLTNTTIANTINPANTPSQSELSQIKSCLASINIANEQRIATELRNVVNFLEKYPNIDWKDNNIIESSRKNYDTPLGISYMAMLAILGNIGISEWLVKLRSQNNNKYEQDSLKIQKQFLDMSIKLSNNVVRRQLENNINLGIIELLIQCQSNTNNTFYKHIEWLLFQPNSVWKPYFNKYATTLYTNLARQVPKNRDVFYNQLFDKLIEREEYRKRNGNYQGFILTQYKNITQLFVKLEYYSLSAFFYQLSDGKVPPDIYDNDQAKIIQTVRDENPLRLQIIKNLLPPFHQ